MVWKYQNEISPIFYYGKKLKTSEKLLKITDIQPPDWNHPYWMTLYIMYRKDRYLQAWRTFSFSLWIDKEVRTADSMGTSYVYVYWDVEFNVKTVTV